MLQDPNCLISNLEITEGCLTSNGHLALAKGLIQCKQIQYLTLDRNDFGTEYEAYDLLLTMFSTHNLQQISLAGNNLTDKAISKLCHHL